MPERGVQRRGHRPRRAESAFDARPIGLSCVIFELPDRLGPCVGLGDIRKVGLNAGDRKGGRVHLVELVPGVVSRERGNRRTDKPDLEGFGIVDHGRVTVGLAILGIGGVGKIVVKDL